MAHEDLDFLQNFLGFSDVVGVILPRFLGSRRLRRDSGKGKRGPGSCGKVWDRSSVS